MATRCTIKIEGVNYAKIYKHWDGYPDHMLDWLNEFNDGFNKKRGENPEYKFCLLYTSPSPRDRTRSRMPSSA